MYTSAQSSFRSFLFSRKVRFEWLTTLALFLITCTLLLWIYPFPNVYSDTGAYIDAAKRNDFGIYRPIGYSWFMAFAHAISPNPDVLVILQAFLYFLSSLILYLTLRFFFHEGKEWMWSVFYFIFLLAPTCIYIINFVISDSIFISFTNLWIASLLWIIGTRKTSAVFWNSLFLILLLQIRFIALFYPLLSVIAIFIAFFKTNKLRFLLFTGLQVAVFFGVIWITAWQTGKTTGVTILSGFSGWQKANNVMHVLPYIKLKPEEIKDPMIRKVHAFIVTNTPAEYYPPKDSIVVLYLWAHNSPLKKYMYYLKGSSKKSYLHHWHQASIPLNKWSSYIIRKHPGLFARHFIWPNTLLLFNMYNEALFTFPDPSHQMKEWFGCYNCTVKPRYNFLHRFLAQSSSKSFNILWVLFFLSLVALCFRLKLRVTAQQYHMLLLVSFFCITYVAMSVYASPIVLRYLLVIRHSLILVPFLLLIHLFPSKKT